MVFKRWNDMTALERMRSQCKFVEDKYIDDIYDESKKYGLAWELGINDPRIYCGDCVKNKDLNNLSRSVNQIPKIVGKTIISMEQFKEEWQKILDEEDQRYVDSYHTTDGKYHNGFSDLQDEMVHYSRRVNETPCFEVTGKECIYCHRDKFFEK